MSGTHHFANRSKAGSPLDRHPGKRSYSFTQKWQRTYPIIGGHTTVQDTSLWLPPGWLCQGHWQGTPFGRSGNASWMGDRVYTFFLQYYRSTFTRSPVSVSSLLETFLGPAQDCSVLVNRGGGLWEEVWEPKPSGTHRPTSRPLPPNDSGSPLTSRHFISLSHHVDPSFLGPTWWLQFPGTTSVEDMCHRSTFFSINFPFS